MENEDEVRQDRVVEARARNISHNVRCTECGSQSIEDSQADIAILLHKLIRDEIRSGKNDKEIYKKLEEDFGETVLYTPKFDIQTAAIWLAPLTLTGGAVLIWAFKRYRRKNSVHIMALDLDRGVPLTPKEKEAMLELRRHLLLDGGENGFLDDLRVSNFSPSCKLDFSKVQLFICSK